MIPAWSSSAPGSSCLPGGSAGFPAPDSSPGSLSRSPGTGMPSWSWMTPTSSGRQPLSRCSPLLALGPEEAGGRASVLAYLRDVRDAHRWAVDFFLEEVLNSRPREDQQLLMRTAVVTDDPDAIARFEALTGDGLLLIPLDARGEWFRCHSLFAELLRLRLRQAHPELERELRRRAASAQAGGRAGLDAPVRAGRGRPTPA